MATSEVEICRNALLLLGDSEISSFDDEGDRVTLIANLWPNAREAVLRAHPWNCAVKRVALAAEATAPDFDYAYSFLLPGDWLRTLSVGQKGDAPAYEQETRDGNRVILMDDSVCYLRYIFKNENVATYDSMLVAAMESYMAMLAAYPITKSAAVQERMASLYEGQLKRARSIDGQEQPPEDFGDFPLLAVRR